MHPPPPVTPRRQARPAVSGPELVLARLRTVHGDLEGWWPIDRPYHAAHGTDWRMEVCVGAILTQNTSWRNVGPALENLKERDWLRPQALATAPQDRLASAVRPAGFHNQKARYLRGFARAVAGPGGFDAWFSIPTTDLRKLLLTLEGVGPETADAILVYAARRPVFVVDAYARRLTARLGWAGAAEPYERLQGRWSAACGSSARRHARAHALIVEHAKACCKARAPVCDRCPLLDLCPRRGVATTGD